VTTLDEVPFVDIFSAEFQADAPAAIDALRGETWLLRTPIGAMVIGREQVQALVTDRRLRSAVADLARVQGVGEGPLADRLGTSILALEGDDHTRLRKLVSRAFTPRSVEQHRPHMRAVLTDLVEPVRATGRSELMADVLDHYPIRVMCHMLGVPEEDHDEFAEWNRAITWALSFSLAEHRDEVDWGMSRMDDYVAGLVADRRRSPRDDMVTALVQAEEADDRLTDGEIMHMVAALLFAGYDTTRNQLGLGMWLFAEHADQWLKLGADPALVVPAVEEMMRYHGAVAGIPRIAVTDIELDGHQVPAGTIVMLSTASANHDPATYVDPWTFDITVPREPHLTFGGGVHYCLGASLARAEMQEALPILTAAMPDLALDGEPTWRPPMGIFGPESLPVRFTPTG
jgi:hypothetical protein